ncbi:MAG: LemA family protein [Planctomycetota bacterium]|nr:MAG: LemA family protein [Planctomycetota bacterium]
MTELIPLIVIGVIVLLVVLWVAGLYNGLIRAKNTVDESWADIDTELRRRYDLIPNLIETVKGYATHEKEVLERVIQARNQAAANHGSVASQAADENALVGGLRQLFALAESYPDLKANQNFMQLQGELANTEDRLQRSRRFYNANVRDLNNRLEVFPSNIVAQMFGFRGAEYFEIDDPAVREAPTVKF